MGIKKELGIKIKRMRINRGLTQEQLAEMVDVSQRTMSGIEIGENFVPNFSHYYSDRKLNKILGIKEEPDEDDLQEVIDKHLQKVDVLFTEQTELAKLATTDLTMPDKKKDIGAVQIAVAGDNAVQVQKFGGVHIWD